MTHLVVGTAGHIDHGKSALVLALTGTDPDRLKEEKARGITIDLGFAHWEAPDLAVAFVDVPGHERFVKNMLAGVGGIDAVALIVAADESVMPQTREHFEICRLLRIPAGFVVLTKADLVDAETLDLVRLEVRDLVSGSFLADAPIVAASARTGAGLDDVRACLRELGARAGSRSPAGPARLPIDRVFSVRGFGTVVTGTLVSGRLALDDTLDVVPGSRGVGVRGIQVHGSAQLAAVAGQRVAVNLGGVDVADLLRGQTLSAPGALSATRVFDARIEMVASARPLRHGARVRVHQGTAEVLGRVALSSRAGAASWPGEDVTAEVPAGACAYVRVRLESPVALTRGDRFVLRAYSPSITIAGGAVLDPFPPRGGIRTAAGRQRFLTIDPDLASGGESADARAVMAMVVEGGGGGLPLPSLATRLGLTADAQRLVVERLAAASSVDIVGQALLASAGLANSGEGVLAVLAEHHRANPLSDGAPREEVRERLFAHAAPGVFERVLDQLVSAGRIVARERLALASHRVAVAGPEAEAQARIVEAFRAAGLKPPDAAELAATLALGRPVIEKLMALLVRQRVLVKVDTLVFHAGALAGLVEEVRGLKAAAGGAPATLDVARFKERYGITRKYAIPLLEYLDRERVTRRMGDARVVI
jgi:selenocysteine-specific elongation factor